MMPRAATLAALILAAGAYANRGLDADAPVNRAPLAQLSCTVGEWRCAAESPFDRQTLAILRVDDYLNRTYVDPGRDPVGLYVGYYASQRQGDTIHSPQNCLPGAGWQPLSSTRAAFDDEAGARLLVNEYVVQKDLDRQVVLYWYEGRGRVIASEYANKFWLMADAVRLHRSNGAIVRVVSPAAAADAGALAAAAARAERFARAIHPSLSHYLP
jgi:EpsI family protein